MVPYPLAWLFFLTFILLATFTVLNLFIGLIVKAMEEPRFEEYVKNSGGFKNGSTGEDAVNFLVKFESTASWLIYNAGGAKHSPAEFGIPEPQK